MAITSPYQTYADLYEAVIKDAKESTSNTPVVSLVKRYINEVYENVNTGKKRTYLDKTFTLEVEGKTQGTCHVTNNSSLVTFTGTVVLPVVTAERGIKIKGFEENYEVTQIAGQVITLNAKFKGTTATAATAVIYQRSVILDESLKSVYQVYHNFNSDPLKDLGPQDMRRRQLNDPETYDYADSFTLYGQNSAGDRRLVLFPYPDTAYTLYLDGNVFYTEMVNPTDEPLIPMEYRQTLYHGALAILYGRYHRNVKREEIALAMYGTWLKRLDAESEAGQDYAQLVTSDNRPSRMFVGRPFDRRYREES